MSLRCSHSIAATVGPQVVGAWEGPWLQSQSHPLAVRARRTLRRSFGHLASHPNHVPQPRTNNLRSLDTLVAGAPPKVRPQGPTPKSFAASEGYAVRDGRVGEDRPRRAVGPRTLPLFSTAEALPRGSPRQTRSPLRPKSTKRQALSKVVPFLSSMEEVRPVRPFVGRPGLRIVMASRPQSRSGDPRVGLRSGAHLPEARPGAS
jgi:hypothetical protein